MTQTRAQGWWLGFSLLLQIPKAVLIESSLPEQEEQRFWENNPKERDRALVSCATSLLGHREL